MKPSYILKGHLIHTPSPDHFTVVENGCLPVENGVIAGCFPTLPEKYAGLPLYDFGDRLIIPGLCDTHVHAPQYAFRGLGMDLELLDWLNLRAFPQETRYADLTYARKAYGQFARDLQYSATTRASVFATLHVPGTLLLTELLEAAGVRGFVGKVNMDRNAPENLREESAESSLKATEEWLDKAAGFENVTPILTPRFIPSCTDGLLDGLAALRKRRSLPLQSHLSENLSEIAWVKELCPDSTCYAHAYALHGLLDPGENTVMAHCVHPVAQETRLLKDRDVLVSHCPASNANLASGVAPIRMYLEAGIRVGLGTDVAGGFSLSVFRAMTDAVQQSKIRSHYDPEHPKALSLSEAFYLGTTGGGTLFGKAGAFLPGYPADAVVLDDGDLSSPVPLSPAERIERAVYLENQVRLTAKFADGQEVFNHLTHKGGIGQ